MSKEDDLSADQVWIKHALERWLRRGLHDWRDIKAVRDWARNHPELDFSSPPFDEDKWCGHTTNSSIGSLFSMRQACDCLVSKIDRAKFPGGFRINLGHFGLGLKDDFYKNNHYQAWLINEITKIGLASLRSNTQSEGWYCCRIIIGIIISDYQSGLYRDNDFSRTFSAFAEANEKAFGKKCVGWREAREWAERALLAGSQKQKKVEPPSEGRRLRERKSLDRPQSPLQIAERFKRPGGDELLETLKAHVDELIASTVAGAPEVELSDGRWLDLLTCSSIPERIWRLGEALRHGALPNKARLAAERVWRAMENEGLAAADGEGAEAIYFRGRCLADAARLQPAVDPSIKDAHAMLRLAQAGGSLENYTGTAVEKVAFERAAASYGWHLYSRHEDRQEEGYAFAKAAAERLSSAALEVIGHEGLHGAIGLVATEQAIECLALAHDLGSTTASRLLATAFDRGHGLPQSMQQAQFFFHHAFIGDLGKAVAGDRSAMIRVGDAYHDASWLSVEEAWLGPPWAEKDNLRQWNHDFVSLGARHALTWYLRAAKSRAPFSGRPQPTDFQEPLDEPAQLALIRAAELLHHGLGVPAEAAVAREMLGLASVAGSTEASYQLALDKWRKWPKGDYAEAVSLFEGIEDAELHTIADLLEKGASGTSAAAVYLWHISGLEDPGNGPDRLCPPLDENGRVAYDRATQLDISPVALHTIIALAGSRHSEDRHSEIKEIQASWLRVKHRGFKPSPAMERLFTDARRLAEILSFRPAESGIFSSLPPCRSACEAVLGAPQAVHRWIDQQNHIAQVVADWLELRAQLATTLSDPGSSLWGRASARAQIRTDAFRALALNKSRLGRDIERSISKATAATGPLWNVIDRNGFPIPGTFSPHPGQGILSRLLSSKVAKFLRTSNPQWSQYAPRPLTTPAYSSIDSIKITPDASPSRSVIIEGVKDNQYGLVGLEDIMVILALVLLSKERKDISLSLEPLVSLKDDVLPWRLRRRQFRPAWIGATSFGKTLYAADYLLFPSEDGTALFSFNDPLKTIGEQKRFERPRPWQRAAKAEGTTSYMQGLVQFRLSRLHRAADAGSHTRREFPIDIRISKVSAMVYGSGVNLKQDGEDDRKVDETYWRNYYFRSAASLSANFAEMRKEFPVFTRGALLFGIYAELCDCCAGIELPSSSPLFKKLTRIKQSYTTAWNASKVTENDDIVWSA